MPSLVTSRPNQKTRNTPGEKRRSFGCLIGLETLVSIDQNRSFTQRSLANPLQVALRVAPRQGLKHAGKATFATIQKQRVLNETTSGNRLKETVFRFPKARGAKKRMILQDKNK